MDPGRKVRVDERTGGGLEMNIVRKKATLEALVRSLVHTLIIAVWYVIAYKIGLWLFGKTGGWWMAWGVVWLNLVIYPHRRMVKE